MDIDVRHKLTGEYGAITLEEGEEVNDVKAKIGKALGIGCDMFVLEVGGVIISEGEVVVGDGEAVCAAPSRKLEAQMYFEAKGTQPDMKVAVTNADLAEIEHCYTLDPAAGNTVIYGNLPVPVAELLLSLGASALSTVPGGCNMAHSAASHNNTPLLRLALEHGCSPTDRLHSGATVLHLAARSCTPENLRYLLSHHTRILPKDNIGSTLLHAAVQGANLGNVKLLIEEHQHPVHPLDSKMHAPLHFAAETGSIEICEYLLSKGATVKQTRKYKSTPLHFAAQQGHAGVISLLIRHGAELDAVDKTRKTPLMRTCIHTLTMDSIGVLVEEGSDINAVDGLGDTALSLLLGRFGDPAREQAALVLLEKGANPNIANKGRALTPLHRAASAGLVRVMEKLVQCGADVNAVSSRGLTPLHMVCKTDNEEAVQFLCQCDGIDPTVCDAAGDTPLHINLKLSAFPRRAVLASIVGVCPAVKTVADVSGKTPFDVLVAAHPEAIELHDLLR